MNIAMLYHTQVITRTNYAHGISFSAVAAKKHAINLAVSDFCINTHTHTHTHTHTLASGVYARVNILIIINTRKGGNSFLQGFPPFSVFVCPMYNPLKHNVV